jgi:RNA polymerase sigma-70 factor (ECF subfamily)
VSALRKLGQFRGDAAFTTWMHRVAVNACYDLLRKRSRQPLLRLAADDDLPTPEAGPPAPDHADEVAGTHDAAAALARIPEEFRVALVLADVQDLPYEQIAKILDVPIGTVKSRVFRGRIALAQAIGVDREPRDVSRTSEDEA